MAKLNPQGITGANATDSSSQHASSSYHICSAWPLNPKQPLPGTTFTDNETKILLCQFVPHAQIAKISKPVLCIGALLSLSFIKFHFETKQL